MLPPAALLRYYAHFRVYYFSAASARRAGAFMFSMRAARARVSEALPRAAMRAQRERAPDYSMQILPFFIFPLLFRLLHCRHYGFHLRYAADFHYF
jgi:hypothetical protein